MYLLNFNFQLIIYLKFFLIVLFSLVLFYILYSSKLSNLGSDTLEPIKRWPRPCSNLKSSRNIEIPTDRTNIKYYFEKKYILCLRVTLTLSPIRFPQRPTWICNISPMPSVITTTTNGYRCSGTLQISITSLHFWLF